MNRITDKDITKACNDTWDLCGLDRVCKRDCYKPTPCMIPHIVYRLAEIEDILGDEYDLKRLREILKAEEEDRCVILPVKPGTQVWSTVFCRIDEDGKEHPTFPWEFTVSMFEEWGTGWHLTEKDAEAELEKENENGEN